MLPVSGAAQLNTWGAKKKDLPVISHKIAYSRLEIFETPGKNRFQSPFALALA